MFCEKCGEKLDEKDKFCESCGFGIKENEKEVEHLRSGRFISKFTLVFVGLILLSFFVFWIYKFGIFTPERGTSTASASALWGQFVVSLLAVVVFCTLLIFLDMRKKVVKITRLVSFWIIIILILFSLIIVAFYYYKHHHGQSVTPTSTPLKSVALLEWTFITLGEYQCSNIDSCWINLPIQGITTKGSSVKMIEPFEKDIKVLEDGKIRDLVRMKVVVGVNYLTFQVTYPSGKTETKYEDTTLKRD